MSIPDTDGFLTDNASANFECRWVTLRSEASVCPWIVEGETMPVPIAHAEGRFVVSDEAALDELFQRGQVALTYVDPADADRSARDGDVPFPHNPNGSVANIAGICDPTGRVFGLMPHPERNISPFSHPQWTRLGEREHGEGLKFFQRMVQAAAQPVAVS